MMYDVINRHCTLLLYYYYYYYYLPIVHYYLPTVWGASRTWVSGRRMSFQNAAHLQREANPLTGCLADASAQ